jgi:hypothetical protein
LADPGYRRRAGITIYARRWRGFGALKSAAKTNGASLAAAKFLRYANTQN